MKYLKKKYPNLYFVSSTTKVLTNFNDFKKEVENTDFTYVVPDFRLNKQLEKLNSLSESYKPKVEFLCNECCWYGCKDRKECYKSVSKQNLGIDCMDHVCKAPFSKEGYRFSRVMENPAFISLEDILNMNIINMVKKYQKKKAKKAAKEELKQMIPTLRGQLNEVTSGLDELNGLLKKITRS